MRNKIFWLTGLPCSGKTTIANELSKRIYAECLDGDDLRNFMKNEDFSYDGREKHMITVAEIAYRMSKYNNVIVSLVSPIKAIRKEIKNKYPNVVEIFIKCGIKECFKRDVKGLYKLAKEGKIRDFTGIDSPYEAPTTTGPNKTTFVDTEILTVGECVDVILSRHYERDKHSLFIGRWQPLHEGHKKLFSTAKGKLLIGIRDTGVDKKNPYSVQERIDMIKKQIPDAKYVVLPDILEVCYGRGVGYDVRKIELDKKTEEISATKIREGLNNVKKD